MSNFTSQDICILVPTKDRPIQIKNFLESVLAQTAPVGLIIIVDGGQSVEDIVMSYKEVLPVEYYRCVPPGQIKQRNYGIEKLGDRCSLVAFFDDDISMEPTAIEYIVSYLNTRPANTAAVVFNIVDVEINQDAIVKFLKYIKVLKPRPQGLVLKSGRVTSLVNATHNQQVSWALGGATIYKTAIVRAHKHREIYAKRAVAEDLIYSYPIGLKYPIYLCADAKVRHEAVRDHVPQGNLIRYYAYSEILWILYFVSQHKELSTLYCVGFYLTRIAKYTLRSLRPRDRKARSMAIGYLLGLLQGCGVFFKQERLAELLVEDYA